ncbi:MAG: ribonuclease [Rickettsiaceae bacterium]|jgi:ribonuclease HII|nr:ribonuclease [Rickettsiaceae bacterium]
MPDYSIELSYPGKVIAGIDEAGRGPLAGPVVAAAVIIDPNKLISGINDSKLISEKKRLELYEFITANYLYAVGIATPEEIDRLNILNATKLACTRAFDDLRVTADIALVDGNMKFDRANFVSIVKGDKKSLSIAAASIIAKVTRDRIMQKLETEYPIYNWGKNKGYPTKDHAEAIKLHGPCPYHRKSFRVPEFG